MVFAICRPTNGLLPISFTACPVYILEICNNQDGGSQTNVFKLHMNIWCHTSNDPQHQSSCMRSMLVQSAEASEKLRDVVTPYVARSKQFFQPVKDWLRVQDGESIQSSLLPIQQLARRMRENLQH